NGDRAVGFGPGHSTRGALTGKQPLLMIDGQTICQIRRGTEGLNRRPLGKPLVADDPTVRYVAEEQVIAAPERTFGEPEPSGDQLDRRVLGDDLPEPFLTNLERLGHRRCILPGQICREVYHSRPRESRIYGDRLQ